MSVSKNLFSSKLLRKFSAPDYGLPIRNSLQGSLVKDIEDVFRDHFEGGSPKWKSSKGVKWVSLKERGLIFLQPYRSGWDREGFNQHFITLDFQVKEELLPLEKEIRERFEGYSRDYPMGVVEVNSTTRVDPTPPGLVRRKWYANIRPNLSSLTDRQIILRRKRNLQ